MNFIHYLKNTSRWLVPAIRQMCVTLPSSVPPLPFLSAAPPHFIDFYIYFTCTPYIFYLLYKIHVYPQKKILRIQEYYSKLFKVPEVIPQLSFPGTYLVYIIINCTSKIIPTLLVIITCTKWKYTYIHTYIHTTRNSHNSSAISYILYISWQIMVFG